MASSTLADKDPKFPAAAPADDVPTLAKGDHATPSASRRLLLIGAGGLAVLALALGLGRGLGLKHHHDSASASAPGNSTGPGNGSAPAIVPLSQLVNASQFMLDPAFVVTSTPTTRTYQWTVSEVWGAPMGVGKKMLVVNGISPGPNIEANTGDRLLINVTNALPDNATAIHWHGLYQNGTAWYDGTNGITQCGIPPGQSLLYNFTLDGGWTGTTWWHAHFSTQYTDGLFGALVVHSPTESVPKSDGEAVVVMADAYNTFSAELLDAYLADSGLEAANEPVPDGGVVNGVGQNSACGFFPAQPCFPPSYSNLTLAAHKTYRLRLINAGSFAAIAFAVDGHALTLVEVDGTAVVPLPVAALSLQVAQRASVLLTTDQPAGAYWIRATVDDSMFTANNPALNTDQRAVLRYAGVPASTMPAASAAVVPPLDGALDAQLVPADAQTPPAAQAALYLTFNIQKTLDSTWRAFFNGTAWAPPAQGQATLFAAMAQADTTSGLTSFTDGTQLAAVYEQENLVLDVIINNLDDGDHPFHLHGHKPFLVGTGAGQYHGQALGGANPMRRDTFLVPAYTWGAFRVVLDHAGYWALHCHIAWHMAAGGLMQVVAQPAAARLAPGALPPAMVRHCAMRAQGLGGANEPAR